MKNERTYGDNGTANILRHARSGMTVEGSRKGGLALAQIKTGTAGGGHSRADKMIRKFSWENEG